MSIAPEVYLIAPAVVFAAYVVFGLTGFGSALINIPVLAHFLPLHVVVPLGLLLDFSASMLVGTRFRRGVQKSELALLIPFGLIGTAVGAYLLVKVPRDPALLVLGTLVILYGAYNVFRNERLGDVSRHWAVPAGLAAGVVGGWFGTGGPLFVMYLTRRLRDTLQLKATLAAVFSFQTMSRIIVFLVSGLLLQRQVLLGALSLIPVMLLGLRTGNALHERLPKRRIMQSISAVLILSGAGLIARALEGTG